MNRLWVWGLVAVILLAGCTREPEKPSTNQATATAPGANGGVQSIDPEQAMSPTEMAAKADVPLYPDADTPDGKSSFRRDGLETRYELIMTTPDAPEKVLKFYEGHLTKSQRMGPKLMGSSKKGNSVMVSAEEKSGLTTISVVSMAMATK